MEIEFCSTTCLLDLPWEDILCRKILPFLSTWEVCRLKLVNKNYQLLSETYFRLCHVIDLSQSGAKSFFSGQCFEEITKHSESLRELNLKTCKKWLQDKLLIPVVQRNTGLRHVDISGCLDVTNDAVRAIALSCKALKTLRLQECRWLSSDALKMIGVECHNLHALVLTGCWNINNDSVRTVFMNNKSLNHVDIGDCYGIDGITISYLAKNCRKISYLGIKGCWRVKNEEIRLVAEYCKGLKELKVKDCRDVTEASLAILRVHGITIDVPKPVYQHRPFAFMLEEDYGKFPPILNVQI